VIRVYCAGKISGNNDWRFRLFPDLREVGAEIRSEEYEFDCHVNGSWSTGRGKEIVMAEFPSPRSGALVVNRIEYAGPFFVARCLCCDSQHGVSCYQGEGDHGQGVNSYGRENHGPLCGPEVEFQDVIERCLGWLDASDAVFVWLNGLRAYGTAAELGYAKAKGIPIYAYTKRLEYDEDTFDYLPGERCRSCDQDDMWFALRLGSLNARCVTVEDAWTDFLSRVDRELRVLKLRRMPYQEYLQTDHWKAKRAEALAVAEYRCQVCNGMDGITVHHRTYERRGEELLSDLIALCKSCHGLFHGNGKLATSKLPSEERRR
jgi:hypothetical protein